MRIVTVHTLQAQIEKEIVALDLAKAPRELYAPVSYMMSMGGKRIRPLLCLLSYNLFNDHINKEILLPAVGIEIFHGFTLVHDDVMDQAPVRRGYDTVHKKWNINVAMLSGDVMCIMAYRYLCEAAPQYVTDILQLFGTTAAQVCEGQQFDMNYEHLARIEEEEYLQMIELKTAVLLAASAQIGAIAGGATVQNVQRMYKFGRCLGMAFQIQDDLLDAYGDSNTFGKTIGGDIITNKKTFLLVQALKKAQGAQQYKLEYWLKNRDAPPEEKITNMLEIYNELNIYEQAGKAIDHYFGQAEKELTAVALADERKEELRNFAFHLINRKK
ncbi:MAG: polyprenyl synthetase family protein [Prevotellaceae bacterium]|jgi:geranylgeranyl diphosphate synthase type II|nr:polyprenyl synthetase family protein [Prevotellaceae bacterium]